MQVADPVAPLAVVRIYYFLDVTTVWKVGSLRLFPNIAIDDSTSLSLMKR